MVFNLFKFKADFVSSKKKEKPENVLGLKYRSVSEFPSLSSQHNASNINNKVTKSDGTLDRQPILKPPIQNLFNSSTSEISTPIEPTFTKSEPSQLFIDNAIEKCESPTTVSPELARSASLESSKSVSPELPRKSILKKTNYESELNTLVDENDKATLLFMTENHEVSNENDLVNGDVMQKYTTGNFQEEQVEIKLDEETTNFNEEEQIETTKYNVEEQIETTNFNEEEQVEITNFNEEEQVETTSLNKEEQVEITKFNEEQMESINLQEEQIELINSDKEEQLQLPKYEEEEFIIIGESKEYYKVHVEITAPKEEADAIDAEKQERKIMEESKDDYDGHVETATPKEESEVSDAEKQERKIMEESKDDYDGHVETATPKEESEVSGAEKEEMKIMKESKDDSEVHAEVATPKVESEVSDAEKKETKIMEGSKDDYAEAALTKESEVSQIKKITTNEESKDDYKVHVVDHVKKNEESEVSDVESEEEDVPEYVNQNAYSSQAASIFFAAEEPTPALREKKVQVKENGDLKENEKIL